jgi:hypothetical protein
MRPLGTWLVVGALALLGLFAARDALRGDEAPASAPTTTLVKRPPEPAPAPRPTIDGRKRLSSELRALGTEGVLYLTDADCRRFLLALPELRWTAQGLPGLLCPDATPDLVDERFGLEARQVDADLIEVRSEGWHFDFRGTAPAFTPEGGLTFLRNGHLWEWTVRCLPGVERTRFRGLHTLERCQRPVAGAPDRLRELVWLSGRDFVAVAGGDSYSTLMVDHDGKQRTIFRAIGARMGALEASPLGRYVAARIDGDLAVFDVTTGRPVPLPSGTNRPLLAIAWSPDDRFGVVASQRAVHVYPIRRPSEGVTVPVGAVAVSWR